MTNNENNSNGETPVPEASPPKTRKVVAKKQQQRQKKPTGPGRGIALKKSPAYTRALGAKGGSSNAAKRRAEDPDYFQKLGASGGEAFRDAYGVERLREMGRRGGIKSARVRALRAAEERVRLERAEDDGEPVPPPPGPKKRRKKKEEEDQPHGDNTAPAPEA